MEQRIKQRPNHIATKMLPALLCLLALMFADVAHAQAVGTVTDLSGPLLARKIDGVIKILAANSSVDQGDTLITEKNTYARIKFVDNGEITLKPNTQFKINNFFYEEAKPENDSEIFTLIKGGLRSVTGLLGKRNKERFGLNTPSATIGIRGTIFIAEYIPPTQTDVAAYRAASLAALAASWEFEQGNPALANAPRTDAPQDFLPKGTLPLASTKLKLLQLAQAAPGADPGLNPGLYVQVLNGAINVSNSGGAQNFTAGQFGYTPSLQQPPIILPANPGIQFTPPPSFSTTGSQGASSSGKPGDVDCVVR